jgi:hypothetical protein
VVPTTGTTSAGGPKGPTGETKRPMRALSWNPPDRGQSTLAFLGDSAADGARTGKPQGRGKTGKYSGRRRVPRRDRGIQGAARTLRQDKTSQRTRTWSLPI